MRSKRKIEFGNKDLILKLFIGLLIATCVIGLQSFTASAQMDISVDVGFNGAFLSDHFAPVAVHLQYQGHPIQGEIVLTQRSKQFLREPTAIFHRYAINLGANVDQLIHFYFPVSSYPDASGGDPKISLSIESQGEVIARREVEVSDEIDREPLVLFVSEIEYRRTLLSSEQAEYIAIDDLPQDWRGLDGVERIYFGRAKINQLSGRQEQAIENWIMAGGELVVLSGENFTLQDSTWLRGLIPFEVQTVQPKSEQFPAIAVGSATGELIFSSEIGPLLVEKRLLRGAVLFATIDLMPRGEIQDQVWSVLAPANGNDRRIDNVGGELLEQVTLAYPSKLILGLGILLYLGVFGGFSLWILRQPTSRLRASMLDVPESKKQGGRIAAVLLGSVLFFSIPVIGYLSHSEFTSDYLSVEVGIISGITGFDTAWSRNWYSTVTKVDTPIAMPFSGGALVAPVEHTDLDIGFDSSAARVKILPDEIPDWSTKHLFTEQLIPVNIGIARSKDDSDGVRGIDIEVYNNSHWHLSEVALYRDGQFFPIGELPPGGSKAMAEASLQAGTWPRLPQFDYQYNVEEKAKDLLRDQSEVKRALEANSERWMLVGWIGNEYLGRGGEEVRHSIKLVLIEESMSEL